MNRSYFKYLLFIFISCIFSQQESEISTTGSFGTVTINGELYNQIAIRPEIPLGKIGLALDIYLYYNDEGIYLESWNFSSFPSAYKTIIDKIYYLKWGKPEEDFYFILGALPNISIGSGILVSEYSNIIEYPQVRQVGINLNLKVKKIKLEVIHSNFKDIDPALVGVRGAMNILPNLYAGLSYVTDLDQNNGLKDTDGDDYPDYYDYYPNDEAKHDSLAYWENIYTEITGGLSGFDNWYFGYNHNNPYDPSIVDKDPIAGVAFDLTYLLSKKIKIYSQAAKLIGKLDSAPEGVSNLELGWGVVPIGLSSYWGPMNFQLEFRYNSSNFLFNYWNRTYDINRATIFYDTEGSKIQTKESQLYRFGALGGLFSKASFDFINLFSISLGYQDMRGEIWNEQELKYLNDANKTFLGSLSLNTKHIPKLEQAEAFYQQMDVPNPFDFNPTLSTLWGYNLGVEISDGVKLVYKSRTTYMSDPDNINKLIPIETLQIETQVMF